MKNQYPVRVPEPNVIVLDHGMARRASSHRDSRNSSSNARCHERCSCVLNVPTSAANFNCPYRAIHLLFVAIPGRRSRTSLPLAGIFWPFRPMNTCLGGHRSNAPACSIQLVFWIEAALGTGTASGTQRNRLDVGPFRAKTLISSSPHTGPRSTHAANLNPSVARPL